jgi:hypothetical protein
MRMRGRGSQEVGRSGGGRRGRRDTEAGEVGKSGRTPMTLDLDLDWRGPEVILQGGIGRLARNCA